MPSHLPPYRPDQSRVPSLRRVVLHAFFGTTNPSDFLPAPCVFHLPALYARYLPDMAAGEDLSCSTMLFGNVPPPRTPERSSSPSGLAECCLLPSPRHDRLGPFKHLSAENMTRLQRSLNIAARFLAPLCFKGFRHSASYGRISPPDGSLLPGAPALTRTDLSSARTSRLRSGRTMPAIVIPVPAPAPVDFEGASRARRTCPVRRSIFNSRTGRLGVGQPVPANPASVAPR